jgi:ankyrin repeat protein
LRGILFYVIEALERGAEISAEDEKALILAARNGYLDIVKYLVESGADISANGDEALRDAAANGHLDVVKYLVESGQMSLRRMRMLFILRRKWSSRRREIFSRIGGKCLCGG